MKANSIKITRNYRESIIFKVKLKMTMRVGFYAGVLCCLILLSSSGLHIQEKRRSFSYNNKTVPTTFEVSSKFIGKYNGRKSGYLKLNADGTGVYKYDFHFPTEGCQSSTIPMEWGFILKEDGEPLKFEREYGYSYPVLFKSTTDVKFQGCRTEVFLDYLLEYKGGEIEVSSSDDWVKQ